MSVEVPDRLASATQDDFTARFERSGTFLASLDEHGLILAIDADLARQAGPSPEQLRGRPFAAVLHTSSRHSFQRSWTELIQGAASHVSQQLTVGTAVPFRARVTTVLVRHTDGRPVSAVVVIEQDGGRAGNQAPIWLTSVSARVLEGVAAGASTAELAACLYLSRQGVEYHVATMLRAFGVANRSALVARAYVLGIFARGVWPPRVVETNVSVARVARRRR